MLTRFQTKDIEKIMLIEPVLERYRRMRLAIDDSDAEQRLLLSEWLMGERQYALALREVRAVLEIEASNPKARELELLLSQQVKLLEKTCPIPRATTPCRSPGP